MSDRKSSYISELDFWKFVAMIAILLVHSHTFFGKGVVLKYGFLGVELFFLITGYLFAASVYRDQRPFSSETIGSELWAFIRHKIGGFLPYFLVGWTLGLSLKSVQTGGDLFHATNLRGCVFDLFLLRESGLPYYDIAGSHWYLSSMMIALFLIYPVFRWRKNLFSLIVAPAVGLILLGSIFMSFKSVTRGVACPNGFLTLGTTRAIAEISLGVAAYQLSKYVSHLDFGAKTGWIFTGVNMFALIGAFGTIIEMHETSNQLFVLLMFFIFVVVATSRKATMSCWYNERLCRYLGKLTLSVFLTHTVIRRLMSIVWKGCGWQFGDSRHPATMAVTLAVYLALSYGLGALTVYAVDRLWIKRNTNP